MDLNNSSLPGQVCEGCLSSDRSLTPIIEDETVKCFTTILESHAVSYPLLLCWECTAIIKKVAKFKRQVKLAHDMLIRYMLNQLIELPTLSHLSIHHKHNTHIIIPPIEHTKSYKKTRNSTKRNSIILDNVNLPTNLEQNFENGTKKLTSLKFDNGISNEDQYHKDLVENGISNSLNDGLGTPLNFKDNLYGNEVSNCMEVAEGSQIHPLTFIKVEDQDEFDDDIEGYYVDENVSDKTDINDDTDLKAVLKSDTYKYEVGKKNKKSKRKAKLDDFDASDEEPLNVKKRKEDKESKPRGRRKKKDKDAPKVDGRKHPKPKREKPSGVVNNPRVRKKLEQLNVPPGQLEMVVLSWEEVEEERQKALSSATFTRHMYRCHDCAVGFNHRLKLDNHMKKHDPSSGELMCSVCRVRCRSAHALCAHRRRHRLRWRCVACGATCSRAGVAADHVARAHHAPPPTHRCTTCHHTAPTLGKLRNHIKNHSERQKCELCGKTFRDKTSLRTHLFIHKGEKEYACPRCQKRFLFKKAMEVHLITHDAPAQLYCHQCDMNFKNRMSYYQHMKYNLKHIDPAKLKYACQLCDKKFVKAARLEEHNLAVHLKVTPIQCTMAGCDFACSSRPVLRTHIRMVHRNVRAVRNHVCDACGKAYTTKKTLEGHIRSHTGERPFKCKLCPSTFGYEAALYNHNKLVHLKTKSIRNNHPVQTQLPGDLPTDGQIA